MTEDDLTSLSARIDGIGHTLLHLIAELEIEGVIDGPRFSGALHRWGLDRQRNAPHYWTSGGVVCELADRLDDARSRRSAER
ncbi:hypothetical protein [Paraburkholderia sp.]|uniref:hypothetical protein n=1 Tax=Paraburkholderia sp. TaxID=1926495 RepID=UPI003D6FD4EA